MRGAHVALLGLLLILAAPATASAHAVLEETSPPRGATVDAAPGAVEFRFSEPVESAFGAIRVFDAEGTRVDAGDVTRPHGSSSAGVRLRDGLPDGNYTATYRVVSADSHPVSGGFVFQVGEGGAAPSASVAELAGSGSADTATRIGFGIARGVEYAAIAIVAGGLFFFLFVWSPALAGGGDWRGASDAFGRRLRTLLTAALILGAVAAALGIVFQAAVAGGTSFWDAAAPDPVREVLGTRFGTVWGLRLIDWLLIAGLLVAGRRAALLALPLLFLVVSPGLAGHAGSQDPTAVLVPVDALHVTAMSVWVGGLVMLVAALPAATRTLPDTDRTRLLAPVLGRFSPIALAAVIVLLASGTVQSILYLEALGDLVDTAFGRAILIKIGLIAVLIAFGAWNQRRGLPAMRRAAEEGATPGATGRRLRRSLRSEVALLAVVIGVTSALVSYSPTTSSASGGPYGAEKTTGPVQTQLTVDPARAGPNAAHMYLFDAATGAVFDKTKELTVTARLPDRDIGPLPLRARRAGPGHYVVENATLAVKGDWTVHIQARVSEFDEYAFDFEVPIR